MARKQNPDVEVLSLVLAAGSGMLALGISLLSNGLCDFECGRESEATIVFAGAGLAALGGVALSRTRHRPMAGALVGVAIVVYLLWALFTLSGG